MATNIDWPITLPQNISGGDINFSPLSNVVRTEMSTGYAKVRKKYTGNYKRYNVAFEIDLAQYYIFKDFFESILGYGILSFNLPDPLKINPTIECRIIASPNNRPYTIVPLDESDDLVLSFIIEQLPV